MSSPLSVPGSADYVRASKRNCPTCGGPMQRIARSFVDRLTSIFSSKHRYRCRNFSCRWEGVLPAGGDKKVG